MVGGNSPAAVRRAGLVADGWFPFTIAPDDFADAAEALRAAGREAGREADAVELSAWPGSFDRAREHDVDLARRYVDAGARRLVIAVSPGSPDHVAEQVGSYRQQVLDRL